MKKLILILLFINFSFSQNPTLKYNILYFEIPVSNNEKLSEVLNNHPKINSISENKYHFSNGNVTKCKSTSWFLSNEEIKFDIKINESIIEIYNIRFSNSINLNLNGVTTNNTENSLEFYALDSSGKIKNTKIFQRNYSCLELFFKETLNQ